MADREDQVTDRISDLLPDGCISLGFVASIKALSPDGSVSLYHCRSLDLNNWEAAGMLVSALDDQRDELRGIGDGDEE